MVRFGVPVILLGLHLLPPADALRLPIGTIVYNLEQIRPGAWAAHAGYLNLLLRLTVWDFDAANVEAIRQATGHRAVHHVPIGYVPQLTRILPTPAQDLDVLFYGSITPRRKAIFQALAAAGMTVHVAFGVYGSQRDALIARAKVVLSLHAHDNWGFETVRIGWLLANRKAVVCEANAPTDVDADLRDAVLGVPYAQLVEACRTLVRDDVARHRLEQTGWAAFSARDEAAILRRALTAPPPLPAPVMPVATGYAAGMRDRYLDLLAKSLTNQIYGDALFDYWSGGRFNPQARSLGRDWPSQAMTMIGDRRLDNIRQLFAAIVAAGVPGDLIETGVWRGGACIFMRGLLLAYAIRDRRVWVADSFAGLPPPDPRHAQDRGDQHHNFAELSVRIETVRENFRKFDLLDEQVVFLQGWFADTLPAAPIERLALLRLDGDMYGSTIDALTALYHKVSPGGFVIVDDYGAVPACRAAVTDFRETHGITAPIHDIDGLRVLAGALKPTRTSDTANLPISHRALPPRHPLRQRTPGQARRHRLRHPDPVHARRHDPAGIPRALPRREKPLSVQAVPVRPANYPDRRRRAGLHPRQHRVVHGEAGNVAVEFSQCLADRLDREAGQAGGEVGGADARLVGRHDLSQRRGGSYRDQVADQLGRGGVIAAAGPERALLPFPLECDAGQRVAGVVVRRDADHDAGVGVELGARILTHAVGDDAADFRGCRHDASAGAHAEAVNRASVAGVVHQFVVGGTEQGMAGE